MKKLFITLLTAVLFTAAVFAGEEKLSLANLDCVQFNQTVKKEKNLTIINGKKAEKIKIGWFDLNDYGNQDVTITLSGEIKVSNIKKTDTQISWIVNDYEAKFPEIANVKCKNETWTKISGKKTFHLGSGKSLYISPALIEKDDLTIYLRNFEVKISGDFIGSSTTLTNWMDAPSLKEAYKDYFDYIGFATPYANILSQPKFQEGLAKHVSSITMENETKPDFIFNWKKPSAFKDFTGTDGTTIKVPGNVPDFGTLDRSMEIAKKLGLNMRGHVLVWHSQTPKWFFHEDYNAGKDYVTKEVMDARMEWYIKSVLEHVKEWEDKNYDGKRLITTWDIVNEAISDGATEKAWARSSGSDWYNIYKGPEFILNAFRYATKYAPEDLLLAYNDYNCYSKNKAAAICKIIDMVQQAPDARIDVIGMQSHVSLTYPAVTGPDSYEATVKKFLAKGVDVQVTEMDMASGNLAISQEKIAAKYEEYFKMFLRNRKTDGKNGIRGVTLWGVVDEQSWIYRNTDAANSHQSPLLFFGNIYCKPAFFSVLEAAKE